jgi:L-threonylcarbamoyladenylate synthase
MNIYKATRENIKLASVTIKNGGLVAFPTETVYGLGADGLNPIAVAKIFETKKRPAFNPLILHICKKEELNRFAVFDDKRIIKLIQNFWPGPLTLVLPKKEIVPDIVTSGNSTVAIRMPYNSTALDLIKKCKTPIAAPSANKFGQLSPTEAAHVEKSIGEKVDMILDGGKCSVGVESTILQLENNKFILLRPGGLSLEDLEKVIGKIEIKKQLSKKPNSPGQLPYHYSPSIPLFFLTEKSLMKFNNKKIGALFFKTPTSTQNFTTIKILSESGDLKEAAANLFTHLHALEKENIDLILVEPVKKEGLGLAIMDRLKKGTKRFIR